MASLLWQLPPAVADSFDSAAPASPARWSARNHKAKPVAARPQAIQSGLKWRNESSQRDPSPGATEKVRATHEVSRLGNPVRAIAADDDSQIDELPDDAGPALASPKVRRAVHEVEEDAETDDIRLLSFTEVADDSATELLPDEMTDDEGEADEDELLDEEDLDFDADEIAQRDVLEMDDVSELSNDQESDNRLPRPSLDEAYAEAGPGEPEKCPSPRDLKPINQIDHRIAAEPGKFPNECSLSDEPFQPRNFARVTFTWKASALCHKPLYFEQTKLERYGHTFGPVLTPIISIGHFFVLVPALPYQMGMDPPWECVYPLGLYRPGDCAPYTIGPLPLSARGAVTQGVVTTGLWFLFP